ncbi:MAG: bifunctional adenosylcobinamide kinase/adenosylcobinamide-phosphate guanylyltransferase, partial [Pseudomonadota bacterium]|nr:bifunctional adenosylcobinamide kinase/adenosylcobinamide-phosphate guanylyltransferase [Pseudomonadota bacterium]
NCSGHVILVASETGLGIIPENKLSRQFRDANGRLSQAVAAVANEVFFVAAGIALRIKPQQ